MLFTTPAFALSLASSFSFASASEIYSGVAVRTHNAPGTNIAHTLEALHRALSDVNLHERSSRVLENSTTFEKSFDDAVLLSFGNEIDTSKSTSDELSIKVTCTKCYIKANATAQLTVDGNVNATQEFETFKNQISGEFNSTTDKLEQFFRKQVSNETDFLDVFDIDNLDLTTTDVKLNIHTVDFPGCFLSFQFDDMELYMMMDTTLSGSATYTINIYTSNTPLGISIGKDSSLGIIFTIDLILSTEAPVSLSSGFHIKVDDGASFHVPLLGENITDTNIPGGKFEFLPVTIQSEGGLLNAVLRIGVHAGFDIHTPNIGIPILSASAGVEVGLFVNIAEFTTNVTTAKEENDLTCELRVVETYQLAVGATAGATIALNSRTWGPDLETTVPLFSTVLADACATRTAAAVTTTPVTASTNVGKRADLETITTTEEVTFTGVMCQSTGLINCPLSLQSTTVTLFTTTLVTAVPSGDEATFRPTTRDDVTATIEFGSHAQKLFESSGSPVSFTPTPTPTDWEDAVRDKTDGVDKRTAIGVSVGVVVTVLAAIVAGCM
ncbi:uncharacterized protein BCR38DRAFT_460658 [Pseudomassariella vexata]|uniref:Mid2 domain-containing protein n=1 Tax=Pseudomassariella vexata TaxID=1141098 RepID=A0A1Y2DHQ3_9PEZI|nr:uncharacterized protein BCR38DRAFT_460658 [Pseudomassariella vexata]ORY58782.1 hypothetical protein BCR38DRAFT_460658 [Pseudomassariella vexata]